MFDNCFERDSESRCDHHGNMRAALKVCQGRRGPLQIRYISHSVGPTIARILHSFVRLLQPMAFPNSARVAGAVTSRLGRNDPVQHVGVQVR